jgi:hypothetical protein
MDSERPPLALSLVEGGSEGFSNWLTEKGQLSQPLPNWMRGVNLSPTIDDWVVQWGSMFQVQGVQNVQVV